jgi:SAM-dependent methyltransferase
MDWIAEWKRIQKRAVLYRAVQEDGEESYWSENALSYDRRRAADGAFKAELDLITGLLEPTGSLLEIGAGTGAFTLPLARQTRRVTAVEPSPSMRQVLGDKLAQEEIANVHLIEAKWQDAQVEPADAVLASGCSYVFYDIEAAVRKMMDNARRVLILTAGDWGYWSPYKEAARALNVPPPVIGPGFIQLYNVLYQLGIYANVAVFRQQRELMYESMEHAVQLWSKRLALPEGRKSELRAYIEENAKRTPTGKIRMDSAENTTAVIWHEKHA